ncbi:MAG: alpha/beta fold hydrolase [Candidatus Neomarinimicrobiota bacterium]
MKSNLFNHGKSIGGNLPRCAILIALIVMTGSCDLNPEDQPIRGEIVSATALGSYTSEQIATIITLAGFDNSSDPQFAVDAYRIIYETIDPAGADVKASGALFVPVGGPAYPLLSLQHGTVTERDAVASVHPYNSGEGFIGLIAASRGYCTAVPDYLGYGQSELLHPYLHARSLASAVIDFIRAGRNFCREREIDLDDRLFLTGYSEGGYATLATHREIEQNFSDEFNLTAVAPMAGPYDLTGTVDSIFQDSDYTQPLYPAFILAAYADIYDELRLADIFQPPYAELIPGLFDGTSDYDQITAILPGTLGDLFHDDFISGYLGGNEPELTAILRENTLLDWHPSVPLTFFHGDADETVPYYNALTAVANLSATSTAAVNLVTIPGGSHGTAILSAFSGMFEWLAGFESLAQ